MVAYLFAGQGSQYVGMGKDLAEVFPQAKEIFERSDKVLGFSLSQLCFEGPQEKLKQTQNCQPAILTMSLAAYEAFKAYRGSGFQTPSYVAGLSLGEYSALVCAGAMSFEDALYLVRRRGEIMEEEALKRPGRMLSVIGLNLAAIKQVCSLTQTEIANINCPGQIVLSGGIHEIEQAKLTAKELGAKMAILLEVSGAFHSSFMRQAALKLAQELDKVKIKSSTVPVVCNVTGNILSSEVEIRDNLVKQVFSSVLWEDSMKFMLSKGIKNFIEFGPGSVLKGLMRRTDALAKVISIEKKEDILIKGA